MHFSSRVEVRKQDYLARVKEGAEDKKEGAHSFELMPPKTKREKRLEKARWSRKSSKIEASHIQQ